MTSPSPNDGRTLVQLLTYNTALQGLHGLPQDLVDWLAPSLTVSSFLSRTPNADIVAVGFQELLPLYQGLAGFSGPVMKDRVAHLEKQLEIAANGKEQYSLVAKEVNVGIALLVFAKDSGVARRIKDVQTTWSGCGPGYMGNKGGVAVRFTVQPAEGIDGPGEVYTFVNMHLTAFANKLHRRLWDWQHLVSTLTFSGPSTVYDTSHLFLLGDLNFRVEAPPELQTPNLLQQLVTKSGRELVAAHDQLRREHKAGNIFRGLREGEFWDFAPTYKCIIGDVAGYNTKRTPSWTDRVLYTTYHDDPARPEESAIQNLLYTSIPGYTTSDHKPVVALLAVPPPAPASSSASPALRLSEGYRPASAPRIKAFVQRYAGRTLDRLVGIVWWLFVIIGAGNAALGIGNFVLGLGVGAWAWWRGSPRAIEV
ncbi:unnamed protein product [Peniophora sp. CBMAI 1063]|nr:unnamed protein product [Peniophora sp. CBMAI 1063]